MATDKLITMKQFNGTDYDTLYPKTIASQIPDVYSKTDIITTGTLAQLGLSANKLPNDAFQRIKALIDGKPNIQTGSYAGTGTYGANNPCRLTFNFKPKVVIINQVDNGTTEATFRESIILCLWYGSEYARGVGSGNNGICHVTWNAKTVSWYSEENDDADSQMNRMGFTYYYLGIG